jgi:hypothetical protein
MKLINFFLFFGSFLSSWIRIQPTKINADPDPQHWSCPLVQGSDGCDEGEHVGVQTTGEAFRRQKRTSSTSKHELS